MLLSLLYVLNVLTVTHTHFFFTSRGRPWCLRYLLASVLLPSRLGNVLTVPQISFSYLGVVLGLVITSALLPSPGQLLNDIIHYFSYFVVSVTVTSWPLSSSPADALVILISSRVSVLLLLAARRKDITGKSDNFQNLARLWI